MAGKRTIVFAQHKDGTKTFTRPVAVFANSGSAAQFKAALAAAHAAGNADAVKALDPDVPLTVDDKLHAGTLFAFKVIPYEPMRSKAEEAKGDFEV